MSLTFLYRSLFTKNKPERGRGGLTAAVLALKTGVPQPMAVNDFIAACSGIRVSARVCVNCVQYHFVIVSPRPRGGGYVPPPLQATFTLPHFSLHHHLLQTFNIIKTSRRTNPQKSAFLSRLFLQAIRQEKTLHLNS